MPAAFDRTTLTRADAEQRFAMSYDTLALFPATWAYRWPATSAQGFILCANNEFHDANDQVLATALDGAMPRALERFLIGPAGCEITGPMLTPDRRTFLCSIRRPGSATGFPVGAGTFARPAVVCVFRTDGGFSGACRTRKAIRPETATIPA